MVSVAIVGDQVVFTVSRWHALFAFRRRIVVRLDQIVAVRALPREQVIRPYLRLPGTHIPWLLATGTFVGPERREFWDVTRRPCVLAVNLANHPYTRLVIEVADPAGEMQRLGNAVAATPRATQPGIVVSSRSGWLCPDRWLGRSA